MCRSGTPQNAHHLQYPGYKKKIGWEYKKLILRDIWDPRLCLYCEYVVYQISVILNSETQEGSVQLKSHDACSSRFCSPLYLAIRHQLSDIWSCETVWFQFCNTSYFVGPTTVVLLCFKEILYEVDYDVNGGKADLWIVFCIKSWHPILLAC